MRAVKRYLDRTSQHRPRCERLFVTSGHTKKEISKNTVSFWFRKVISLAYQISGKPLPSPSPLARETRGIAPSLLFKKNYAVSQVRGGATLPSHATTSETCHTSDWIPSTWVQWWQHRPQYNRTCCPRIPQLSHNQSPVTPCPVNQPFPLLYTDNALTLWVSIPPSCFPVLPCPDIGISL